MISALTHQPSTSLLICLLLWIGWILVVPNLAPVVAKLTTWLPNENSLMAEKEAVDQLLEFRIHMGRRTAELYYGREGKEREEKIRQDAADQKRALDQVYNQSLNNQIQRAQNLARLSPAACFLFAATRLAGTGPELSKRLREAELQFQAADEVYQVFLRKDANLKMSGGKRVMRDPDWFRKGAVPRFQLIPEPLSDRIEAALSTCS